VRELAEVLAVDFDVADGIPKLKTTWRWEDQEQALLSSCSSLIAIVNIGQHYLEPSWDWNYSDDDTRVVQFSHFSVKEFLTSPRLATPSRDVSYYHILLEPAHTIMAQGCLSIFLCSDDRVDQSNVANASPLGRYAARYWVTHAQFGSVSLRLRKAMEYLFDPDKPYFATLLRVYNIDTGLPYSSALYQSIDFRPSDATPLYYAALCGLQDLVKHLIVKYPQHVNARGGLYMTPAVAALAGNHFELARLLHRNGTSVSPRRDSQWTPLHSAALDGDTEMVQILVELNADINAEAVDMSTPLHFASNNFLNRDSLNKVKVARCLLEHGADANSRREDGFTPLHNALKCGLVEVARVLIEHGADIDAMDDEGRTPLRLASEEGRDEVVKLLMEYGAK
jgi:ankyrin repeat protein